jgi:hypothetical protein
MTSFPLEELGEATSISDDVSRPIPGYPNIARLMGDFPELAIFRSFRVLNAKNLLYLQAELGQLEKELHGQEWRDFRTEGILSKASRDWFWLEAAARRGEDDTQWRLTLKMREKLREYSRTPCQVPYLGAIF